MEDYKNDVELATYYSLDEDLVFKVSANWLARAIDTSLVNYLQSCTFDDNKEIYEKAVQQNAIIEKRVVDAVF